MASIASTFRSRLPSVHSALAALFALTGRSRGADPVTLLPDRAAFLRRGAASMDENRRGDGKLVGVLFIDLYGVVAIADAHGRETADKALAHFAEALAGALRDTDTILAKSAGAAVASAIAGRFEGGEFTVLLPDLATPDAADVVATRILQAVARPIEIDDAMLILGAGIGVSVDLAEHADFECLLEEADEAMRDVKRAGMTGFKRVGFGRASP